VSFSTATLIGCKKPFAPSAVALNTNYLVIEGLINSGHDSTIINLSRTVNISEKIKSKPELNALVTVESSQNTSYSVPEIGKGKYGSAPLNLDSTLQYRLRVKTASGEEYLSAFVEVKTAPPIDSLGMIIKNNGAEFYVNAHDNSNRTRYYRWDYNETWIFHSQFYSFYKIVDGQPVYRSASEQIYQCWNSDISSTVVTATTIKLAKDVVSLQPVAFVPASSEKIIQRYSIILKQYALTKPGFEYYENIKKNTEQLGSIFDAEPSSIKGNVICSTNPAEPVIGFISAGTVTTKRIFLDSRQFPANWIPYTFYDQKGCTGDESKLDADQMFYYYGAAHPVFLPTSAPNLAAPVECVDCTLRGTTKQPDFWK